MTKKKKPAKNIVIRLLETQKIPFETHTYDPDSFVSAPEVAQAIGLPPAQVFKTLVTLPDKGKPMLALLPANAELDLKALARAAGVKKVQMAPLARAEQMTGLKKGGISSLALINKGFVVFVDTTANNFSHIAMSAGRRGIQVVLAPDAFMRLTGARSAALTR